MDSKRFAISLLIGGGVLYLLHRKRMHHRQHCPHNSALVAGPDQYPTNGGLYPLRHPLFCAREAAVNCALLEDHLVDPRRRCNDCIQKHFLMIQGFLHEGILMDKHQKHGDLLKSNLDRLKPVMRDYINGCNHIQLAQKVRQIRSELCHESFPYFE
jgi:hypothetical protein